MIIRVAGIIAALVAGAFAVAAPAYAGQYSGPGLSADFVLNDPSLAKGRLTGKLFIDRGGSRMDLNGKAKHRSIIFNSFGEMLITMSRNFDVDVDLDRGKALAAQFGDEPCSGFKRALQLGSEQKYGRTILVWRCEQPTQVLRDAGYRRGYRVTLWYDPELKYFVRKENNEGMSIELRNIRVARQPPVLFEAPSDFASLSSGSRLTEIDTPF